MTSNKIAELLALEARATAGEISLRKTDYYHPDEVQVWQDGFPVCVFHHYRRGGVLETQANAEFYAAARAAVRPLCEEVLRLRELLKPFANYALLRGEEMPDDTLMDETFRYSSITPPPKLGDCRRADEALKRGDADE